jgi:hypothetical protein
MRRYHLVVGVITVAVFVGTGQYMDLFLEHLTGMPTGPRLLYRTRHIYILLVSLVHLMLGSYVQSDTTTWRRTCQRSGSALLTLATILYVAGFVYEPRRQELSTPFIPWATYAVVAGACTW